MLSLYPYKTDADRLALSAEEKGRSIWLVIIMAQKRRKSCKPRKTSGSSKRRKCSRR